MVPCPAIISPMTFSVRVDLGPHGGMVSIGIHWLRWRSPNAFTIVLLSDNNQL